MANTVLTPDQEINFPDFTILRASAGSGKTRALAHRYMQFLMSDRIRPNALTNILAITFSNNAAREMKDRILLWLKKIYFGDEEHLMIMSYLLNTDREVIRERAGYLIDHILENYSDFQVRTIDSFMASIFRSSALEFGKNPNTEIVLEKERLIDYSFELFFRKITSNSPDTKIIEEIINSILARKGRDTKYLWNPTDEIVSVFKKLYTKLASLPQRSKVENYSREITATFEAIKEHIKKIDTFIIEHGLEYSGHAHFHNALEAAATNNIDYAIGRKHKANLIRKDAASKQVFDQLTFLRDELNDLYRQLTEYYIRSYYHPHVQYFENFSDILRQVKKDHNQIFIDDIGKLLVTQLEEEIIPYIYFMLGDTIHHYLIDEFQDTSPLQWADLKPLIENSLSAKGSLFVVGDTKQAIYKFRGADFKIMKEAEDTRVFASAPPNVFDLDTNYRSSEHILQFNETFFNAILNHDEYGRAVRLSRLDHHTQNVSKHKTDLGYAECIVYPHDEREENNRTERQKIITIIQDALSRGYNNRDIAVLTFRNRDVTNISSWLSEENIKFISFSNLDVRNRKITGELISLLQFLNSPVDDLALASFCLGDICNKALETSHTDRKEFIAFLGRTKQDTALSKHPLYKNIQTAYPDFWNTYFEQLFLRAAHLSIYDLTQDIYKVFRLFKKFSDEEAALAKFLEAIKDFEATGTNSLRAFLEHAAAEESESEWNIDKPDTINAVQLMTIHKAKGLGFPVVIIPLYNDHRMQEDFYIDESGEFLNLLYINSDHTNVGGITEEIYESHKLASIADYLNGLYVACTRAEEEMYVIGLPPKRPGKNSIFSLLPQGSFGEKSPTITRPAEEEKEIKTYHHQIPAHFDFGDRMPLNIEELQRGEFIHDLLAKLVGFDDDLEKKLQQAAMQHRYYTLFSKETIDEMVKTVSSFIVTGEIKPYFELRENRIVYNETDITDASGRLFRIDRLVVDRDAITAIDFKTGDDRRRETEHISQVKNYQSILRDIYPDKIIRGLLAYIDKNKIQVVV